MVVGNRCRGGIYRLISTVGTLPVKEETPDAVVAFGSNLGDRLGSFRKALTRFASRGIQVLRFSRLYESAAAYVTDQPPFLNMAVAVRTDLPPKELLTTLKGIEAEAGRNFQGQRWGPRPLDLDIIFQGDIVINDDALQLPHARWQERNFVKAPVSDLYSSSDLDCMRGPLVRSLRLAQTLWHPDQLGSPDLRCVLPLGGKRLWPWQHHVQVMGILNVTPDSFSDGGLSAETVEAAVVRAQRLVKDGADVIDIGGQSTRPGAITVAPEEELSRILPVIRRLRKDPQCDQVPISVDTFSSEVARGAVQAGADIVNDVSGGTMDPSMHSIVAELGVSYVLMHMRGTPQTMQTAQNTQYTPGKLAVEVGQELQTQADAAVSSGIEPWRIILDPGIGFAKTREGNCELIRDMKDVRHQLRGCLQRQPILAGPSRKGFLGWLTGRSKANERDTASAVAAGFCISNGANIIRMHNALAGTDAVRVAEGIMK